MCRVLCVNLDFLILKTVILDQRYHPFVEPYSQRNLGIAPLNLVLQFIFVANCLKSRYKPSGFKFQIDIPLQEETVVSVQRTVEHLLMSTVGVIMGHGPNGFFTAQ